MSQPIRPNETSILKQSLIPNEVFDAFNELIARHWNGRYSTIKQKDVVSLIIQKLNLEGTAGRQKIFDEHWLDVEDVYPSFGWDVDYDRPGYNETYEPTYTFTKNGRD